MTVVAGTSHSDTGTTTELTKKAEDLGADGVMITPPYGGYNGGGFDCLRAHYDTVSRNTDIGIVIYFSGNVLPLVQDVLAKPSMMLDLVEACNGHASGLKDASQNFQFYRDVSLLLKDKVSVMGSAGMNYFFFGFHFGSPCFLTGLGNIWPQVEIEFYNHMVSGDIEAARKIVLEKDLPYLKACMKTRRYWACLHALQESVGLPGGPVRQPLLGLDSDDREAVKRTCSEIGLMDLPVKVPVLA
jgi:4-hydroxy-tetrahydrodipicolinate synthase